jgi:ABC-type amino acid transport substrate-binding protein
MVGFPLRDCFEGVSEGDWRSAVGPSPRRVVAKPPAGCLGTYTSIVLCVLYWKHQIQIQADLLMTPEIIIGVVAIFISTVAIIPAVISAIEGKRQRRIAELALKPDGSATATPVVVPTPSTGTLSCGIYDYPPLSTIMEDDTNPAGLWHDLAQMIALKIGRKFSYSTMYYTNFYSEDGITQDLVVGMFDTRKRREKMVFSIPFHKIGLQGICRIEQQGNVLRLFREGRLKAAVYYGEVGWEFALEESKVNKIKYITVDGGNQLDTMAQLRAKNYDIVIMDHVACERFLRVGTNRRRYKLAFDGPLIEYLACIALKRKYESELPQINAAILAVRNTAVFMAGEDAIIRGYKGIVSPVNRNPSSSG